MPINNAINSVITSFTPTPYGSTTPGTPTGNFFAFYFRIGKMVFYNGALFISNLGGMVGEIRLPIPVPLDTSGFSAFTGNVGFRASITKALTCSVAGTQYLALQEFANNNPPILDTDIGGGDQLRFNIWYLGT